MTSSMRVVFTRLKKVFYYSSYSCCSLTIMSTLFMGYLLQSVPVIAAYLCYANAPIRVKGQFLSDFIKEMIEAIKPTQLHTPQRDTLSMKHIHKV